MTRKKRSNFYRLRLKLGLTIESAASLCGVTTRTIKNWDHSGAPLTAMRLLQLSDKQHVGHEGWSGFMFSRGVLIHGKSRWRPETLKDYPELLKQITTFEMQVAKMNTWRGWLQHGWVLLYRTRLPKKSALLRVLRNFRHGPR